MSARKGENILSRDIVFPRCDFVKINSDMFVDEFYYYRYLFD